MGTFSKQKGHGSRSQRHALRRSRPIKKGVGGTKALARSIYENESAKVEVEGGSEAVESIREPGQEISKME